MQQKYRKQEKFNQYVTISRAASPADSYHKYENKSMNKILLGLALTTLSLPVLATQKLSTSELKSLDCTSLAVEKANAVRDFDNADQQLNSLNAASSAPANAVSKWAGLAGNALSAFSGNSDTAARASNAARNMSNQNPQTDNSYELNKQREIKNNAKANVENITIFQTSKGCPK
jgi:hypothetical protein